MPGKLENSAELRVQLDETIADMATDERHEDGPKMLATFLSKVQEAIPSRLHDLEFLKELWDSEAVSATGQGTINIDPLIQNEDFRNWFASQVTSPLPDAPLEAEVRLTAFYDELVARTRALCDRTPYLKINRVLCAIYPKHFTSLAKVEKLRQVHEQLGGSASDHPVRAHKAIRSRIDDEIGQADNTILAIATRICLIWCLTFRLDKDKSEIVAAPGAANQELKPQPASLRRRGLTHLKGRLQTVLALLPDLHRGVTAAELIDGLKQVNPETIKDSYTGDIHILHHELNLCEFEDGIYQLNSRGIRLLESQDPDALADHLLTSVLGIDHLLKALESAPCTTADLAKLLKRVNPGWTTNSIPDTLLGWLSSLGLIDRKPKKPIELTERGKRWAASIYWTPEFLPQADAEEQSLEANNEITLSLPAFIDIESRLKSRAGSKLAFNPSWVQQLHSGLWCHPVRHFAVLSGISGSGKTQLALNYALSLHPEDETAEANERVVVIPVQPGWHEPGALLGYVNPLIEASYRSTPFLELILRAAADPEHAYVAILDELNLSHPEHYLAPVLSAMETHGWIDLHQLQDESVHVPKRVQYPANLAIIGTLNMDETTLGLSDKVLDRAYTLEFWDIKVENYPGWATADLPPALKEQTLAVLTGLGAALSPVRQHFGWRTIDDVLSFLKFHATTAPVDTTALDNVIYAKVLPKLRGETSIKFRTALEKTLAVLDKHELKRCREKVFSMQEDLLTSGSARFWR